MGIFGAATKAVGAGSGGSANGQNLGFDMAGYVAQGGKLFDAKGMKEYRDKQNQQQSADIYQQSNENAQTGRVSQSFATQPSAGIAVGQAPVGSTMSSSASSPMQGSQSSANDHTHEENNNTQPGGMTGVGGGIQPGLQGLATAVTGNPQGVGAASSQPVRWGKAGMAANKAARRNGASNVASQNQTGQDMFGGQSMPAGMPGIFQKKQF